MKTALSKQATAKPLEASTQGASEIGHPSFGRCLPSSLRFRINENKPSASGQENETDRPDIAKGKQSAIGIQCIGPEKVKKYILYENQI